MQGSVCRQKGSHPEHFSFNNTMGEKGQSAVKKAVIQNIAQVQY